VCREDAYLKQLVAYIHLNPLRADLVVHIADLADYPYCGHGAVLGRRPVSWQDKESVLRQFGESVKVARRRYLAYVTKSAASGRQPDLASGTVERRDGGWKPVRGRPRKGMERRMRDSRILGGSAFVHAVLAEARQSLDRRYARCSAGWDFERVPARAAAVFDVPVAAVRSGGRHRPRALACSLACYWAVRELGMTAAEVARRLGLTADGVNAAVNRGERVAV